MAETKHKLNVILQRIARNANVLPAGSPNKILHLDIGWKRVVSDIRSSMVGGAFSAIYNYKFKANRSSSCKSVCKIRSIASVISSGRIWRF
jgi:hypothetical protein